MNVRFEKLFSAFSSLDKAEEKAGLAAKDVATGLVDGSLELSDFATACKAAALIAKCSVSQLPALRVVQVYYRQMHKGFTISAKGGEFSVAKVAKPRGKSGARGKPAPVQVKAPQEVKAAKVEAVIDESADEVAAGLELLAAGWVSCTTPKMQEQMMKRCLAGLPADLLQALGSILTAPAAKTLKVA